MNVACFKGGLGRSVELSFLRLTADVAEGNLDGGVFPPLAGDLGIPEPGLAVAGGEVLSKLDLTIPTLLVATAAAVELGF